MLDALEQGSVVTSASRLYPVRWSSSGGRLLFREEGVGVRWLDPAKRVVAPAPDADRLWAGVWVEALTHGDDAFFRTPASLASVKRIERDGVPARTFATVGARSATFLAMRRGSGSRLTAYEGSRRWDTGIPMAFTSAPLLLPGSGRLTFLGDQAGHATFLPYALPVIDRGSGNIVGRFGWDRIELHNGRVLDLARVFKELMTIKDATAQGDAVFALVDLEREKRVVRFRDGQVRSWRLCRKEPIRIGTRTFPPLMESLPAETPVVRSEIRFGRTRRSGKGEAAPFGFLYRPVGGGDRLVIYFHGGPTSTLAESTVPQEVSRFAAHGVSVLAVEYSGSVGGGLELSRRLPRLGLRALREDMGLITDWARRSGFRHRYVLADSFGGTLGVLAQAEHADAYEHFFLRVPMLALRTPEESVRRGNFGGGRVPPASQLEFEQAVYGGARSRFHSDLRRYVTRLRPSPKLSFYFGTLDPVSSPDDLPSPFRGHPSLMILRGQHAYVGAARAVWRDIFDKMNLHEPAEEESGYAVRTTKAGEPRALEARRHRLISCFRGGSFLGVVMSGLAGG